MATIKDIADAAGVSIGTVDRILHNRGRFSEKTARKVRQVMEELNYTPNIHARGLKKTKSHIFAAVVPLSHQDGGYWQLVEEGILKAARALESYGGEVRLYPFDRYSSESCKKALDLAMDSGAEALLAAPVRPEEFEERLEKSSIPYIFIDTDIPGMTGRAAYIGQDSFKSGFLAAKLMMMLMKSRNSGRSSYRILVVDPPGSNYHLKSRLDGFRQYMEEQDDAVELEWIKEEVDDEQKIHLYLEDILSRSDSLPQGIFVANSTVYYLGTFLQKMGGKYKDIPLIGYDFLPGRESLIEEDVINFILTQQPVEQGYRGIMMLYDYLILKKDIPRDVLTPLNIITSENLHTFGEDS